MPKKPRPEDLRGRNLLTDDEAAALAESIAGTSPARTAELLLLVHAFTYVDADERESLSSTVEDRLLNSLPGADEFRHAAMRRALEELRKGGR